MTDALREEKRLLRRKIKLILSQIERTQVERQSESITRKILQLPEYRDAKSISIFLAMPDREVSTNGIVRDALNQGKRVFIPHIHSNDSDRKHKTMDMLRLKDLKDLQDLRPDAWGIPSLTEEGIESRENAFGGKGLVGDDASKSEALVDLDLIFMPGMAFDAANNRLGHGKGFYDKYLANIRERIARQHTPRPFPLLVGLALREQILSDGEVVPTDHQDWKIDRLVTADV